MARKKTQEKKEVNAYKVRIYYDPLFQAVEDLYKSGQFESRNDLLNRAIENGIAELYREYGIDYETREPVVPPLVEEVKSTLEEVRQKQRTLERLTNDVFVMMSVLETMITTMYNIEAAKLKGKKVDGALMDTGYYSELPKSFQEVKDALIRRLDRK